MTDHNPYVYLLTDLKTGMFYFGCRYARGCDPSDLGVTYFTSSKRVRPLFKEDPERFEKIILITGDTNFVIEFEKHMITRLNAVKSGSFYNLTCGKAIHRDLAVEIGKKR